MLNSTLSDKGIFRIKDWWWSKAALLMGQVYLFTAWFNIGFEKFIPLAMLSICTISGFASLGYLLNDFFDREKDVKAGKKNFLADKSPLTMALLFLIALSFLLLPWRFLPSDYFSAALIISEIFLFFIYSLPPFRLKERGVIGLIVDALYAHALPVILAAYTFFLASEKSFTMFPVIVLFAWQTLSGIRNILIHQADDLQSDEKSGAKNFVAGIFPNPYFTVIRNLIMAEVLLSLIFLGAMIFINPGLLISFLVIILLAGRALQLFLEAGVKQLLSSKWKFFPNNVYEKWIPPSVLVTLSFIDARFITVLFLHIVLFNLNFLAHVLRLFKRIGRFIINEVLKVVLEGLYQSGKKAFYKIRSFIIERSSLVVNYSIYCCFLIFGVDLKKKNSSALDYLRKCLKAK